MKTNLRLTALLFLAVALLSIGVAATAIAPEAATPSVRPCNTDADCPPGLCCTSRGFCGSRSACGG